MTFAEEAKALVGQPESQTLEYKMSVPRPTIAGKVIASFANSEGGWLIIGVKEHGQEVQPIGLPDMSLTSSIIDSALSRINPRPIVQHDAFVVRGKQLYAVKVSRSEVPVIFRGVQYQRSGSHTQLVNGEQTPANNRQFLSTTLVETIEFIKHGTDDSTEAKLTLIQQYESLAKLARESVTVICQVDDRIPSEFHHGRALVRLLYSSLVDTFEKYLSDLLIEIHLAKPDTLKSSSEFTAKEILSCQDLTEVIQMIADKKVGSLSKGGSGDFIDYLKKKIKIELFEQGELEQSERIFATRNLYTHSNGIVDSKFLSLQRNSQHHVGNELKMPLDQFCIDLKFLLGIVSRVDREAKQKFNLNSSDTY